MKNNNKLSTYIDTVWLALGEVIVALLVSLGFFILEKLGYAEFNYTVITGSILGGAVITLNFLILSVGVNRAINSFIEERGDKEMDEEDAAEYAAKHRMVMQNAMLKSYMLRMFLMIGSLVIAGLLKQFNIIATVIPLLMYRPILYVTEFIKVKSQKKRGE